MAKRYIQMPSKQEYTDVFLKNIKNTTIPTGEALTYFWQNIRSGGGLRLTEQGCECLIEDIELECWEIDIREQRITQRFLLDLDRFLDCPYFIQRGRWPKIILFSEKTYFWLILHNKDFERFLNANKISSTSE